MLLHYIISSCNVSAGESMFVMQNMILVPKSLEVIFKSKCGRRISDRHLIPIIHY